MTASSNLTCDELTNIMESLNSAWTNCGEPEGDVLDVLLRWESIDGAVMDGEVEAARLMRRTAESICPGLLAAAGGVLFTGGWGSQPPPAWAEVETRCRRAEIS